MKPTKDKPDSLAPESRLAANRSRSQGAHKQSRSAWYLASGALLLLVLLGYWSSRLQKQAGPQANPQGPSVNEPQPDYGVEPQVPLPVPFGQEYCVGWHVSKVYPARSLGSRVLVLGSTMIDAYGTTLAGFSKDCGNTHPVLVVENTNQSQFAAAINQHQPKLIVAVGLAALRLAQAANPILPIVYSHIPAPWQEGLDREGLLGVIPWIPASAMVPHLLRVLPRKHRLLSVIYPADEHFALVANQVRQALVQANRQAVMVSLAGAEQWKKNLSTMKKTQAWIVLPDRKIIDHRVYQQIQVAAENRRIPLCVSDEEHLRAGAYAAVGPDNFRLGQQLCRLAAAQLAGPIPSKRRVFCPEYSFAAIHEAFVEKLGYLLDPQQLRQSKIYQWH